LTEFKLQSGGSSINWLVEKEHGGDIVSALSSPGLTPLTTPGTTT